MTFRGLISLRKNPTQAEYDRF